MTIHVTPIPRLIDLAAPAFTLGTANTAGSAATAVASDSTLLTFDATVPTTIAYGASPAAGSAVVAARRDHTHGMSAVAGWDICARVYYDSTQSIADDSATALAFNNELFDTDSIHDNSTNNSRLTANTAGVYHVWGNVRFAANATGDRQIFFRVDGSDIVQNFQDEAGAAAFIISQSAIVKLTENQYVECLVVQTSGGSLNVDSNARYSAEFAMAMVGIG